MICKPDAIVNLFSYSKFRILMTLVIYKDNLLDSMNLNYCIELVTMVTVFIFTTHQSYITCKPNHQIKHSTNCRLVTYTGTTVLRGSAANDNLFKLFFLHLFFASKIYNNTFKSNFFLQDTGLDGQMDSLYSILKFYRILLNFHSISNYVS